MHWWCSKIRTQITQPMRITPGQSRLGIHPPRENAGPQAGPYFWATACMWIYHIFIINQGLRLFLMMLKIQHDRPYVWATRGELKYFIKLLMMSLACFFRLSLLLKFSMWVLSSTLSIDSPLSTEVFIASYLILFLLFHSAHRVIVSRTLMKWVPSLISKYPAILCSFVMT